MRQKKTQGDQALGESTREGGGDKLGSLSDLPPTTLKFDRVLV